MPSTFDTNLGVYVRKAQLLQIINAWQGVANSGVPFSLTTVSSDVSPAATFRNLGNGGALRVQSKAGATLFQVDDTGTTISLAAGTVGAPGITQGGDADTGQYKPDVDRIAWSFAGVKLVDWRADNLEFLDQIRSTIPSIAASKPAFYSTAVWDGVGVTFVHNFVNITDTNSAAASLLAQWQVGGVDKFTVSKAGHIALANGSELRANTADASDNFSIHVTGGGAASQTRGSFISLYGNEHANTGILKLAAGNVAGGEVQVQTAGVTRVTINNAGGVGINRTPYAADSWAIKVATDKNLIVRADSGEVRLTAFNDAGNAFQPLTFQASSYVLENGNLGLGITPPVVGSAHQAMFVGQRGSWGATKAGTGMWLAENQYYNGTNYVTQQTAASSRYVQTAGHTFYVAASVAAGSAVTDMLAMQINGIGGITMLPVTGASGTQVALWKGTANYGGGIQHSSAATGAGETTGTFAFGNNVSVTFPTAFTTAPTTIVGSNSHISGGYSTLGHINAVTTTGFSATLIGLSSHCQSRSFHYVAFGGS